MFYCLKVCLPLWLLFQCISAIGQIGQNIYGKSEYELKVGEPFTLSPVLSEKSLTYQLNESTDGLQFNSVDGTIRWTPGRADGGKKIVSSVTALFPDSTEITQTLIFIVAELQLPPRLKIISHSGFNPESEHNLLREFRDTARLTLLAVDPNHGDIIDFEAKLGGNEFFRTGSLYRNRDTLFFEWSPTDHEANDVRHTFAFEAIDHLGNKSGVLNVYLTPVNINFPPVIKNIQTEFQVQANETARFKVIAEDYDHDVLTYSLVSEDFTQKQISIDPEQGIVTVDIHLSEIRQLLPRTLTVQVSDGENFTTKDFLLTRSLVNKPPVVRLLKTHYTAVEGKLFESNFSVFDINGDENLTVNLEGKPSGMKVIPQGINQFQLVWDVPFDYIDEYGTSELTIVIVASDGGFTLSEPAILRISITERENPESLKEDYAQLLEGLDQLSADIAITQNKVGEKKEARRVLRKSATFASAILTTFGAIASVLQEDKGFSAAGPYITITGSLISGFIALFRSSDEFKQVEDELINLNTEVANLKARLEIQYRSEIDKSLRIFINKSIETLALYNNHYEAILSKYSGLIHGKKELRKKRKG